MGDMTFTARNVTRIKGFYDAALSAWGGGGVPWLLRSLFMSELVPLISMLVSLCHTDLHIWLESEGSRMNPERSFDGRGRNMVGMED